MPWTRSHSVLACGKAPCPSFGSLPLRCGSGQCQVLNTDPLQIYGVVGAALFSLVLWPLVDLVPSDRPSAPRLQFKEPPSPTGSASPPCPGSSASLQAGTWSICWSHSLKHFPCITGKQWEGKTDRYHSILIRGGSLCCTFFVSPSAFLSFVYKLCPKASPRAYISSNLDLVKCLKSGFSLPLCCNVHYFVSLFAFG